MDEETARWLGGFARRRAPSIPDLSRLTTEGWPGEALEAARLIWRRRMVNEALSVDLARRLRRVVARLDDERMEVVVGPALERLEDDEARHVAVATRVLRLLGDTSEPEGASLAEADEPVETSFARLVSTGLCVCESISAARFSAVREHTDLPTFRACIDLFHRDEVTHAELGFVLLPHALVRLRAALGASSTDVLLDELRSSFGHLDRVVGLDLERRGGAPSPRPQPTGNPGVVEPAIDAFAFYRALHDEIVPRLEALGVPAQRAWSERR